MAILICISLYVREIFCFKQISSHRFFRQRGGGFSAHANETINTRLLTLTNSAPLPSLTLPPHTGSGRVIGPAGNAQTNDSTGKALRTVLSVPQEQRNVYSLHINTTLFSTLKNNQNKYFCNENTIYCR